MYRFYIISHYVTLRSDSLINEYDDDDDDDENRALNRLSVKAVDYIAWLGGVVVRAVDLQLEIAGSIPAAAPSLFTRIVQRLRSYDLMALYKSV